MLEEHDPAIVHIATPDYLGQQVQKWAIERGLPIGCSYHTRFNSYLPYYVGGGLLNSVDGALWRWLSYFYDGCDQVYVPVHAKQPPSVDAFFGSSVVAADAF